MKGKKVITTCIIIILTILVLVVTANIRIFRVINDTKSNLEAIVKNSYVNEDICIIKYTYTTGSGWIVLDSRDSDLLGQNVCIYSIFDPRMLKDNKEFDLDYLSKLIVIVDKVDNIVLDGEVVKAIYPKDIIILYDTDKRYYKLTDLSLNGWIKSLLGVFNNKCRFSY